MSSAIQAPSIENLILNITQDMQVRAPLDATFAALLEQLGPGSDTPEGKPLPMKLEAWPGGRWYRDLGDGDGHFWGTVQAIKRPALLEICGPLFMSYAVVSNIQYRLSETEGGTLIAFHHFALGAIPAEMRQNINKGWTHILGRTRTRAESAR
ncbi:MAG TPA: SRPBCC domain-containing protein [Candidatus Acidoferrales bacterium]|nr:SRPBCC domain-containing protein [Candidatus Acidoferrales bacterium]